MKLLWKRLIVAVVLLAAPLRTTASAEGVILPSGTRVLTPDGRKLELAEPRFLVERDDIDYYNALQLRFQVVDEQRTACEDALNILQDDVSVHETGLFASRVSMYVTFAAVVVLATAGGYLVGKL